MFHPPGRDPLGWEGDRGVPKDPPHPLRVEESHVPDHGTTPVVADQHRLRDALWGGGL